MNTETKKCPYCAEEINKDAIKCKHCGEFLNTEIKSSTPPITEKIIQTIAPQDFKLGIIISVISIILSLVGEFYEEGDKFYWEITIVSFIADVWVLFYLRKYLQNFKADKAIMWVTWNIALDVALGVCLIALSVFPTKDEDYVQLSENDLYAYNIPFLFFYCLFILLIIALIYVCIKQGIAIQKIKNDFVGLLKELGMSICYLLPITFLIIIIGGIIDNKAISLLGVSIETIPTVIMIMIFSRAQKKVKEKVNHWSLKVFRWILIVGIIVFLKGAYKSHKEKAMTVEENKNNNPSQFLDATGTFSKNLFDGTITIHGTITNSSTITNYKDIILEVVFYTKTKIELARERYDIYEYVPLGTTVNFELALELNEIVVDCEKLSWDVVDATTYSAVEQKNKTGSNDDFSSNSLTENKSEIRKTAIDYAIKNLSDFSKSVVGVECIFQNPYVNNGVSKDCEGKDIYFYLICFPNKKSEEWCYAFIQYSTEGNFENIGAGSTSQSPNELYYEATNSKNYYDFWNCDLQQE